MQAKGKPVDAPSAPWIGPAEAAERGKYPHYMLKEIFEQPGRVAEVLRRTLRPGAGQHRVRGDGAQAAGTGQDPAPDPGRLRHELARRPGRANTVIETLARLPVEVEYGSEMRYRSRPIEKHTLVVSISQSGETADTLAAIRGAKAQGARTLAIVNVVGSTIARESDADIYMRAGPEIGVASTKAFEMQVLQLTLLGIALARQRGELSPRRRPEARARTRQPSRPSSSAFWPATGTSGRSRGSIAGSNEFLYMGRQYNFPVALEGALKLKEISYIHAEGLSLRRDEARARLRSSRPSSRASSSCRATRCTTRT